MEKHTSSVFQRRVVNSFGFSLQGLQATFREEEAFRVEIILAAMLIPLGLFLGDSGTERALLIGSVFLVLIVEVMNSAIESVVDRFGGEQHDLSGRAKDQGSAAVFLSLMLVVLVWALLLLF
ncbi:diacylglycerol kinase [Desulfocapsa sulfexigens DSM 10523]|uniref:Diacylglycerol kinase n=1 Tax=Desulfocapsa sulfexigens (strain DSM 10523 / SB164P1) TaxID=1167006 RepID=M1NF06_DESSD|nr:diacylglycerol kinase [Desulfocapsa sulfexigens]AGF78274.1 diacylglycerol kinase [Desulfocapsa sulfexigens DSM 10523]